jgi:hypothetical protein
MQSRGHGLPCLCGPNNKDPNKQRNSETNLQRGQHERLLRRAPQHVAAQLKELLKLCGHPDAP